MVGETVKSSAYMAAPDQISPQNFVRLSRFIQEYSGIKMPPAKNTMLAVRLRSRVAALSCASLDEYCDRLFNRDGMRGELIHLINAVSTNKTDFFREPVHFDFIREHLLPEINAAGRREVKLWSAAASMGAEAYTLAMVWRAGLFDHRDRYLYRDAGARNRGPLSGGDDRAGADGLAAGLYPAIPRSATSGGAHGAAAARQTKLRTSESDG
jgi:hypothetical protein